MSPTAVDPTTRLIIEEEGEVLHAYTDSLGYLTIGVGRLIDQRHGGGISTAESRGLLANDLVTVREHAALLAGYSKLNPFQKAAVESMIFQLGIGGVNGFTSFKTLLASGDVQGAAQAGLESKWAESDSPKRAQREMRMLATGVWVSKL